MEEKEYKLSIVVFTFNHESFIAKTIESIICQKVNFKYELILCDDASTDNTKQIIQHYYNKYPEIIKIYISDKNLGPMSIGKIGFCMTKGYYAVFFDGDDFWTYDNKLQTQIDFLDNNSQYTGSFHDAAIVSTAMGDLKKQNMLYYSQWKFYSQFNTYLSDFYPWQLLERNLIPTASLVFVRDCLPVEAFDTFKDVNLSINWLFHLLIIRNSKFKYFNEAWSVYNDHKDGFSKRIEQKYFKQTNIRILKELLKDNYYCYLKKEMYKALAKEYFQLLDLKSNTKKNLLKFLLGYYLYGFKKVVSESFYLVRKNFRN